MLLAIETSCDETAIALFDVNEVTPASIGSKLIDEQVASQMKTHQPYGGVVPELAAREHSVALTSMVNQMLERHSLQVKDLSAVACTQGPGLKGCLLVGFSYAKGLCFGAQIPLYPTHHMEGHIAAGFLGEPEEQPEFPILALVVSGGHTMLVLIRSMQEYQMIAHTRDDAAGEAFDKGATLIGLPYPGGPAVSKLAVEGNPKAYELPIGVAHDPTTFSFSGMKTALQRLVISLGDEISDRQVQADVAASLQHAIVEALCKKSLQACEMYKPKSFLLTGGVAANQVLREQLSERVSNLGIPFCVPPRKWCTDNAVMIGAAAILRHYCGTAQELNPSYLDLGVKPRWPLS